MAPQCFYSFLLPSSASTQLSWVSFIITLQHSIACWTYNLSGLVPEELSLKPIFGTKKGTFHKNEDRLIVWYSLVFQVREGSDKRKRSKSNTNFILCFIFKNQRGFLLRMPLSRITKQSRLPNFNFRPDLANQPAALFDFMLPPLTQLSPIP